jgi:hypothetical protein
MCVCVNYVCWYVYLEGNPRLTIANEIWIAAALLQYEGRADFSVREVVDRILHEPLDEYRPGLQVHASNHCVASKAPNPAAHRFLHETGRGRRRLYRTGDEFHPNRRKGRTHPSAEELPEKYRYLVTWYESQYDGPKKEIPPANDVPPTSASTKVRSLLRFFGSMAIQEAQSMTETIRQGCERVDTHEW